MRHAARNARHAVITMLVLASGCERVTVRQNPPVAAPPPATATVSGQVIKGYVQGASVFADANGNGQPDANETVVETDSAGRYTLPGAESGPIVAMGGIDTVTNVPLDGNIFRAPPGASVVTPFTTLIAELTDSGASVAHAEEQIKSAFGVTLPAGSTLLDFDSVSSPDGAQVEDRAEVVMNTVSAVRSILAGAGVENAATAAVKAVTELARASTAAVSLENAAVVAHVLQTALTSSNVASAAHDVERVAQAISSVNVQLLNTTGVSEEAVTATRYAQSQLQDLMVRVGATASASAGGSIELSQLDAETSGAIEQVIIAPANVISQARATTIAAEQRWEDRSFALSLRPAVVLVNGQAAAVQSLALRFAVDGVQLQRATVAGGGTTFTTVARGADGSYRLSYDELDKIRIVPPLHFNGRMSVAVTISYAGAGTRPEETLAVEVTAVNDAPVATAGFAASLGPDLFGTVGSLVAAAFDDSKDDRSASGGSQPDTLAGIAIAGNAATASQGQWQYSRDGLNWSAFPDVSPSAALLLSAGDRLRFQPAPGFSGASSGLTAYLVDSSGGPVSGGASVDVTDALRGGASRYSVAPVSVSAGSVISVRAPAAAGDVGTTLNAAQVASGITFVVALDGANVSAGDTVELLLDGRSLQPRLVKVLTAADIATGTISFVVTGDRLGADGAKSIGAAVTYASSGVSVSSGPLSLLLDTTPPAVPAITLQASSDTGESTADGITMARSAGLRIALPVGAAEAGRGDLVSVSSASGTIVQATVSDSDLQTGSVAVRVDDLPEGAHRFAARLTDAAGNSSALSAHVDVAVDFTAPQALALDLGSSIPELHGRDALTFPVTGTGAEIGSRVEVRLSGAENAATYHYATPGSDGRFAVQVNAAAAGPGPVTIAARSIDTAGSASAPSIAAVSVGTTTAASTLSGTTQDEIVEGSDGADVLVAGSNAGQDYFIGGGGFDTLRIDGVHSDYMFTHVPTAQHAAHQTILDGADVTLQSDAPLVRVVRRDAGGVETFYLQAEAVEFNDGTVRITTQSIVAASTLILSGAAGDDRLVAGNGGVELSGGWGNDVLVGGTGADHLHSSTCSGSTVANTLIGGSGDDVLRITGAAGCAGSVAAYGGAGRDVFVIAVSEGFDVNVVVKDFRPGEDRIDLSALRTMQGGVPRTLTTGDLNLDALAADLGSQRRAEIDLSRFVTAAGATLQGMLRLELSTYGFAALQAQDFVLGPL